MSFYPTTPELQDTSRRCCVVCTRANYDTPKGQVCNRCSSVIRATHSARVCLPIPFVKVCYALQAMDRDVGNFIDAVYALLDELDARRWIPADVVPASRDVVSASHFYAAEAASECY